MDSILGFKKEMTQLFDEKGKVLPCTVIDVSGVKVVGERTKEKDGYKAVILGIGRKKGATRSQQGRFKRLRYVPKFVREFRLEDGETNFKFGQEVKADVFTIGEKVKITGVTKGKGFQGVVRRWGFHGGPRTHGQSDRKRAGGSIGAGTTPGRVLKGKKMPGHMGAEKKSILNLEIVKVDKENSLICVKGAVPGARNSLLLISK